jgi:PAS domain S-box-containing protein
LNVDDNEAGRYAVTKTLKNAGFAVMEAACGLDALKLAPKADLVVLDVNLPDINGFEVCRRLKSDPVTSRIPVLHLSATYLDTESTEQGLEGGAEAYLTHPVEPKVLVAYAKALLRTHSLEAELFKSNTALKAITECHKAILRAENEAELTSDVCKILVEVGGYLMAWVGYAEHDKDKTLRPIAHSGHEEGYLDKVRISWSESELDRGPTGTAIRTGEPCLCKFFLTDPDMEPWRSEAVKRGYVSSLSVPLISKAGPFGALTVYSTAPNAFSPETIKFLGQLADDLSYGIESLRVKEQAAKSMAELLIHRTELEMRNEELKTVQANLEQSKDNYQDLYDFAPVGYFTLTHKRLIREVNLSGATLLGAPRSKLINMRFGQFVDPEFEDQYYRHIIRVFRQEEKQSCELNLKRADGSIFYARLESVRRDAPAEQKGTDDGTHVVRIAVTDITDRRQSEEKNRWLAAIVGSSDEAIIGKTLDGTITSWNPGAETIYGYKEHEVIGKPITILAPDDRGDEIQGFLDQIKSGEAVKHFKTVRRTKTGETVPVSLTISPILDQDGCPIGASTIARDISDRINAEKQREALQAQFFQAQKMEAVGTLAGGVAHDFNNLLQIVMGYSEVMLQRKKQGEDDYVDLHQIYQAGKRGAELVKSLMTFSRKVEPVYVPVDLNQEVTAIRDLLSNTIPKTINIDLNLKENLELIKADRSQIGQVLMNLGLNSMDAMPDGGTLSIETANIRLDEVYCSLHVESKPGNCVLLTISDTGQGMDKKTVSHIFEPFFTTKEKGKGTGLGLATVYGIIKQHGGHITCYSEPDLGTTFKIYFPIIEKERVSETPTVEMPIPGGTETILLVEDEGSIRELGATLLNQVGYKVITANDGKDALEIYQRQGDSISLTILDMIMPVMDGKKCMEEILQINPNAKVIIASGYPESGPANGMQAKGTKGFVQKPYNMRQLLTSIRKILDTD